MYYCNTCNQPLCGNCREATHKAKMFARHEIVSLAKRTKEAHKKCGTHCALLMYLMFNKSRDNVGEIVCLDITINCFTPEALYLYTALHEELYIMFSTEKKSMLCINCFRDMPV